MSGPAFVRIVSAVAYLTGAALLLAALTEDAPALVVLGMIFVALGVVGTLTVRRV